MSEDMSNGYGAVAEAYISVRSNNGAAIVQTWAKSFSQKASVLDIGAGHGDPLTAVLLAEGLHVSAIDASPKMVKAFQKRFPTTEVACEAVETSAFFNRKFDGILAIGLMFLLPPDAQRVLIPRLAAALTPNGRLLFSAPWQVCEWIDVLTGRPSFSLGREAYRDALFNAGLKIIAEFTDEGGAHYYDVRKREA